MEMTMEAFSKEEIQTMLDSVRTLTDTTTTNGIEEFLRYPHLERLGNTEVEGIEHGRTYVFPKIDGTNASMWRSSGRYHYGSRNRELSLGKDNAGFMATMVGAYGDNYRSFLARFPHYRLYGEWLVPHTLKGYRDDAWRKFYVFDVFDNLTGEFVDYDDYQPLMLEYSLDFIPCYTTVINGDYEMFLHEAKKQRFLLTDDAEHGEGVVIKKYGFKNVFHRTCWAKLVLDGFKEDFHAVMGPNEVGGKCNEEKMAEDVVTSHLVEKEYNKIVNEFGGWTSKAVPRLIETVYRCVIVEELYDYQKKNLKGSINFKTLKHFVVEQIKKHKKGLF